MRLVVGMTGSSGIVYGIRMLEVLKRCNVDVHLIMTEWAKKCLALETDFDLSHVKSLAGNYSEDSNMAANVSSGTHKTDGMIIIPCSMKTLSSIANGYEETLVARAAGVTIKESRKLVIVPRETPLTSIHLENMLKLARIGIVILPAMPGFYNKPKNVDDLINHVVGKCLDQFNIEHDLFKRWGTSKPSVDN
ncbi:Flavin prenyltransferase UbiX [Candidatus Nitrosotalea sp. TS]|uniref:UbiX family flavin prenyltransferase n=1 Tax=Candidatus Nitrosotalea sp. TS TaxID=2341020 RepID=UPI00140DB157|nr:UbiX family flavin prenyltransferase [Candidatus Nitrosotalea sp. TS]NHI03247.1 Flavin prenyltransferase UbiX [Candidatus Nitrosotalea sp. TS]